MFVELHIIQNFVPSCINRDDTNTPKDCEFGGHRRARISSQCIKRAVRTAFSDDSLLTRDELAVRTKAILQELVRVLTTRGRSEADAQHVAAAALTAMGLGLDKEGATEYLLFIGRNETAALADVIDEHWTSLREDKSPVKAADAPTQRKSKKESTVSAEAKKALLQALSGTRAADLALFGRMIADLPAKNVDAACQVAHAFSTNRVKMDMDFYTAVDDLKTDEETGAGMIGMTGFNSSCFYRYSLLDTRQLASNLGTDTGLAGRTLEAFLEASIKTIPTGKQHSMAAQNLPDAVLAVVRDGGVPASLANAFLLPIRATGQRSLVQASVEAMDDYWGRLSGAYGEKGVLARPLCLVENAELPHLGTGRADTMEDLVAAVMAAVTFEEAR